MKTSYEDVIARRRQLADKYADTHFARAKTVDDARRRRESRRQVAASRPAPEGDTDAG